MKVWRLSVIKLICALGNPGREYSATRHNVAWIFLSQWLPALDWQKKFKGEYALLHQPRKLIFLKPLSFMNNSGESIRTCVDFFSLDAEEILVIHDDLELPFGEVVCKKGGGLGGHNGLKSVNQHLGTRDFHRLRLGIGRPRKRQCLQLCSCPILPGRGGGTSSGFPQGNRYYTTFS